MDIKCTGFLGSHILDVASQKSPAEIVSALNNSRHVDLTSLGGFPISFIATLIHTKRVGSALSYVRLCIGYSIDIWVYTLDIIE